MSVLRWAFPTFFAARRWFDERLTPSGKTCVILLTLCLIFVLQTGSSVGQLFAMFVALLAVSAVANLIYRPRLKARLDAGRAVASGEEVSVTLRLSNLHWLPAYDLAVTFAEQPRVWRVAHS